MFVAPSTVLYTACPGSPGTQAFSSDTEIEELSKKVLANSDGLRLQVVEKDGHYFTLNNTRLQVCQWLETRGHCRTVRIETVPLKSVPEGIKRMMVVPQSEAAVPASERFMTITYEPMERRPRTARDDDNEDHSGSDESGADDSDSFCDEFEIREQQQRRRRQSEESGEEEDTSLL
ncbi:uncharacterized protein LOC101859092 [Aplysia californica]|uniref:Uncharacterized protein LOC101859092 n=1 Tax=Aplysia californica TaxID=6500 RepID=A0ABM1VR77_APLCA|nr:uncharacterized protein LOC101859092 [Aplysia californica]